MEAEAGRFLWLCDQPGLRNKERKEQNVLFCMLRRHAYFLLAPFQKELVGRDELGSSIARLPRTGGLNSSVLIQKQVSSARGQWRVSMTVRAELSSPGVPRADCSSGQCRALVLWRNLCVNGQTSKWMCLLLWSDSNHLSHPARPKLYIHGRASVGNMSPLCRGRARRKEKGLFVSAGQHSK